MIHLNHRNSLSENAYETQIQQLQHNSDYQSSICSTKQQKQQSLIPSDDNCPSWDDWSSSACTKTCGDGELIFTRNCNRKNKQVDSELCRKEYPADQEDKKIVSWGVWTECSKTCGSGERIRTRDCPANLCREESSQTESCFRKRYCPFDSWGAWSSCSRTCGTGKRTRTRECPSNLCGEESSQTEKCHKQYCVKWTGLLKSMIHICII